MIDISVGDGEAIENGGGIGPAAGDDVVGNGCVTQLRLAGKDACVGCWCACIGIGLSIAGVSAVDGDVIQELKGARGPAEKISSLSDFDHDRIARGGDQRRRRKARLQSLEGLGPRRASPSRRGAGADINDRAEQLANFELIHLER